ncbi:MAG: glycosyltransferase involved in cell wall biosynthesis [Bacteroidia bacterium]|jgi:glycosyltransferase involved in cell wall biosynthesis
MKNILFTIPNFKTAGSGREMFNIVEHLDSRKFTAIICVNTPGGKLFDEIQSKGYEIIVRRHQFGLNATGFLNLIRSISFFRKLKIDVWQSFDWSSDFTQALLARLSGTKFVYVKKNMNSDRKAWFIKFRLCSHIIARNTTMVETFLTKYLHKTTRIPGGVDLNRFTYQEGSSKTTSTVFRKNPNKKVIVCMAQISRVKGQHLIVQACQGLDNVEIWLPGAVRDEGYKAEISKLAADLEMKEHVIFWGSVSEVTTMLKEADVFVLPTTYFDNHQEGCPVALMEALSSGLICIASDVAGNKDLILDGKTGYLFEAENPSSLKSKLELAFANNNIPKMRSAALSSILADHTLPYESKQFAAVYESL